MTVIIRDLDKPAECDGCKFCLKDHGRDYCIFNGEYIDWEDGTINLDCPLEEYEEPRWIPVTERLPKETHPDGFVYVSAYDAVTMHWGYGDKNVQAWMPLPEPYRGDK